MKYLLLSLMLVFVLITEASSQTGEYGAATGAPQEAWNHDVLIVLGEGLGRLAICRVGAPDCIDLNDGLGRTVGVGGLPTGSVNPWELPRCDRPTLVNLLQDEINQCVLMSRGPTWWSKNINKSGVWFTWPDESLTEADLAIEVLVALEAGQCDPLYQPQLGHEGACNDGTTELDYVVLVIWFGEHPQYGWGSTGYKADPPTIPECALAWPSAIQWWDGKLIGDESAVAGHPIITNPGECYELYKQDIKGNYRPQLRVNGENWLGHSGF